MNKIRSYFLMFCLSLLLINQSIIAANAIPIGAILKGLKGASKVIKPSSKILSPGVKINKSTNAEELISNTILKSKNKEDILNAIKDPSAFKHHLLNDITYDRKMFFEDAPFTPDKQELIESNKGEFLQEIEERHANNEFPFGDHKEHKGFGMNQEVSIDYKYRGMVNRLNLRRVLKKSEEFKDIYFSLNEIEIALKKISTKWPNGEWTKQIILSDGKRIRVYCTHPIKINETYITEMTEGELGKLYEAKETHF